MVIVLLDEILMLNHFSSTFWRLYRIFCLCACSCCHNPTIMYIKQGSCTIFVCLELVGTTTTLLKSQKLESPKLELMSVINITARTRTIQPVGDFLHLHESNSNSKQISWQFTWSSLPRV